MVKVYISGPIEGTEGYKERFKRAEKKLQELGYAPVNPVKVFKRLPKGIEREEYLEVAITLLKMCDCIFMLEGWEEDINAEVEFEYACEHNISITFEGGKLCPESQSRQN